MEERVNSVVKEAVQVEAEREAAAEESHSQPIPRRATFSGSEPDGAAAHLGVDALDAAA